MSFCISIPCEFVQFHAILHTAHMLYELQKVKKSYIPNKCCCSISHAVKICFLIFFFVTLVSFFDQWMSVVHISTCETSIQ